MLNILFPSEIKIQLSLIPSDIFLETYPTKNNCNVLIYYSVANNKRNVSHERISYNVL